MNILSRLLIKIKETFWRYKLTSSDVRVSNGGKLSIGKNVKIQNSTVYVDSSSSLQIGDNVVLSGIGIYVTSGGIFQIKDNSILERERNSWIPEFICNSGTIIFSDHVLAKPQRIWVRFGGKLSIGKYTNINCGSEIRCDENIKIGDFCQISYNTRIWDTNTHQQLSIQERRERTIKYYPSFGKEFSIPKTAPVIIENDCWIGEGACILKGSILRNHVTVGFHTLLSGKTIPTNCTVIQKSDIKEFYSN